MLISQGVPPSSETRAGRGSGGSLLLLLPPIHGDVTVLARPWPALWGPKGLWWASACHIPSHMERGLKNNEPGEEHAVFPLSVPPSMRYWGEEENILPGFAVPSQPCAQLPMPFPTSECVLSSQLGLSTWGPVPSSLWVWVISWGIFFKLKKGGVEPYCPSPPSNFLHLTCYKMSHIKKLYMDEVYPTSVKTLQIKPPSLSLFKMLLLWTEL